MKLPSFLTSGFSFNVGSLTISTAYWQAGAIIFLVFLLFLMIAQMRRRFLDYSVKGGLFGIFFGFLLALVLEGFLIIGGRTALTEIVGWKNAPKPFSTALDLGREKLVNVLGVTDEIPSTNAKEQKSADGVIQSFQTLSPSEAKQVKALICE